MLPESTALSAPDFGYASTMEMIPALLVRDHAVGVSASTSSFRNPAACGQGAPERGMSDRSTMSHLDRSAGGHEIPSFHPSVLLSFLSAAATTAAAVLTGLGAPRLAEDEVHLHQVEEGVLAGRGGSVLAPRAGAAGRGGPGVSLGERWGTRGLSGRDDGSVVLRWGGAAGKRACVAKRGCGGR